MINLFHKFFSRHHSACGAATLVLTVFLFILSSLIIIYSANHNRLFTSAVGNVARSNQAFEAAEAGLEFAINYLNLNSATIKATASGGYINYSDGNTTNITQSNGSTFTATYTNPIADNYDLIRITSVGTSSDGDSTHTVQQEMQSSSMLVSIPTTSLSSQGSISLSGSSQVVNPEGETTILAGETVSIIGGAETVNQDGVSSTSGSSGSDISEADPSLTITPDELFQYYFGVDANTIKNMANYYYNYDSNQNYNTILSDKGGNSVWIDQTSGSGTINSDVVIGTATSPVLLIVNGSLKISGDATFYGMIFVLGSTEVSTTTGSINLYGSLISTGSLDIQGSSTLTFDSGILSDLQEETALQFYSKVPGSWRDF